MSTIRPSVRRVERDEEPELLPTAAFAQDETPGERLDRARESALEAGGRDRIAKQRQQGKMTARDRVRYLLDAGSFVEVDAFALPQAGARELPAQQIPGDGLVAGFGRVDGREIAIAAQDFTVLGGSLGAMQARKVCKVMDQARETGLPFIQLNDSGGARIQEGISSLGGYGDIFHRNVALSGVVPQISVILGPCAGGAVYSPAVTDFIIMSRASSHMFVTGPDVVRQVLGEDTTFETLGGADVHASVSGVAHLVGETEREALDYVRELLSFLPSNNREEPPQRRARKAHPREDAALDAFIPDDPKKPYDVRDLVRRIVDDERFLEIHADFAPNVVVGFARIDSRVVGIVANQPA
ncbi:MAG: acyl-CoA carboxylase subunit beta, partial [Thermoplasmatota archaeon]